MTIEEKIARSEHFAKLCGQAEIPEWKEECEQLAEWLRKLQERRKAPEIIFFAKDCADWGTEDCAMVQEPEYWTNPDGHCHFAERRTDK